MINLANVVAPDWCPAADPQSSPSMRSGPNGNIDWLVRLAALSSPYRLLILLGRTVVCHKATQMASGTHRWSTSTTCQSLNSLPMVSLLLARLTSTFSGLSVLTWIFLLYSWLPSLCKNLPATRMLLGETAVMVSCLLLFFPYFCSC